VGLEPFFLLVWTSWKKRNGAGFLQWRAVGGEFDGDVLSWHFARVPVALGALFRAFFERAARRLPGH